jgi:mono/diheme cytochrome c family protein
MQAFDLAAIMTTDPPPACPRGSLMRRPILIAVAALLLTRPAPAADVDFAHDVLPLLKARCAECHTNGTYKAALSMDTREALLKSKKIVPGKSGESDLIARVTSTDADERMPPKGDALTAKEVATLKAWIDQGAPWQDGFSFAKATYVAPLKPRRPTVPPAHDGLTNPIDLVVDAYFRQHKVAWPKPLDDATFARRVYLDVIGLLPTPKQLDSFLSDSASGKRSRLIRQLLDDRRGYAEHWLTFWNDLLRNDYVGTGYIDGGRKAITSWLYPALLDNKPYDQFVRELINPTVNAEGFIKGIKWRGAVNASQVPELQFAQNVGQVFLGVNLKCASCHDSFIDNWKLDDAYGLAAVIAEKPLEEHRCDKPLGKKATTKFLFPELGTIDPALPVNDRLKRLSEIITSPDNGRLSRTVTNRLWHRLMGRGIVHPVDMMGAEPFHADLLDVLANHLSDNKYDLKAAIELIVSSRTYQSQTVPVSTDSDFVFRGPIAKRLTAEQFVDAVWRLTGTAPAKPTFDAGDRGKEPVRAALVKSDPLMRSLGRPNREQVVTTRPEDLSTLQALDLTNGKEFAETLDRGAANFQKILTESPRDELVASIFQSALCRLPTAAELETTRDMDLRDVLWAVLMLPEFQLIR